MVKKILHHGEVLTFSVVEFSVVGWIFLSAEAKAAGVKGLGRRNRRVVPIQAGSTFGTSTKKAAL